jgi:hypothetical protein
MLWYFLARNQRQGFVVPKASVEAVSSAQITVTQRGINWLAFLIAVAFTLFFAGLALVLLITAENEADRTIGVIFGGFFTLFGSVFMVAMLNHYSIRADASQRTITLSRRNPLLGDFGANARTLKSPRVIAAQTGPGVFRNHAVRLELMDESAITLHFGSRADEAQRTVDFFQRTFTLMDQ